MLFATSCLIDGGHESNLHNILDGRWSINDTDSIVEFSNKGWFIVNDTIHGTFVTSIKTNGKFHWAWDNVEEEHSIIWIYKEYQGKMIYYDCEDCFRILYVSGGLGHENEVVKLTKIY